MLKKLFVTTAAAAAMSIPLAGVAWADPPADPGGADNGVGTGGVPGRIGDIGEQVGINPSGEPITPGETFQWAKDMFPSVNMPEAYGAYTDAVIAPLLGDPPSGRTPPGMGVKTLTPGCNHGSTWGGHKTCA
jgi:hypothetical protein